MNFRVAKVAFDRHVRKRPSGCWEWAGPVFAFRGGYGCFTCRPAGVVQARAHRVAKMFELERKLSPSEHVCHRCDNPVCVNPNHLFLGDQPLNMWDMVEKGRQNRGENHAMAKLTEAEARQIKFGQDRPEVLVRRYEISSATVRDIRNGRSWTHLYEAH